MTVHIPPAARNKPLNNFLQLFIVAAFIFLGFLTSGAFAQQTNATVAINAAGGEYTGSDGTVWQADSNFSGNSNTYSVSNAISGTSDPAIYQKERWGNSFDYKIPVANGEYMLNLYFAEIYFNGPGERVFNVTAQNTAILSNFDIIASAGSANKAIMRSFPVTVTNGTLDVHFQGVIDNPKISGIQVVARPNVSLRVIGGSTTGYNSSVTGVWGSDSQFAVGNSSTFSTTQTITGTNDSTLYQNERWGNSFGYQFPVANGDYTLNLYFAEIYFTGPGQRIFNVTAQDNAILNNFDIFANAGGENVAIMRSFPVTVTNGILDVHFQGLVDNAKISAVEIVAKTIAPAAAPATNITTPPSNPTSDSPNFTQDQYNQAINFDYSGENGILQSNPSGKSLGYPCGVPNGYSWKFAMTNPTDVAAAIAGRGTETAGAGYNQVYNACPGLNTRKSVPNARIEFSNMNVDYFSISQNQWISAAQSVSIGGAAYAEDFVNNQSTGADFRNESDGTGYGSVRSGIGNAAGDAGTSTGRQVEDGPVGYNFHGFPNRFNINWADAQAVVVSLAMRCVPNSGTDLTDCNQMGYIANVGLDSWATTTSAYDGFQTHGGVGGGRFKPVTTNWQVFTNYNGPISLMNNNPPPIPQF